MHAENEKHEFKKKKMSHCHFDGRKGKLISTTKRIWREEMMSVSQVQSKLTHRNGNVDTQVAVFSKQLGDGGVKNEAVRV